MRLDKLLNNNLDGKGPDNTTEKSIRFGEVIVKDGEALDLVVTNENPYAGDSRNGKWHDHPMGCINVAANYALDVKLTFVKPKTMTPVVVDGFLLSIADLDTSAAKTAIEQVTIGGYLQESTLGSNSTVLVNDHDGVTTFTATIHGSGSDNPTDMMNLTDLQASKAVSLVFGKVSEVKMTLQVLGGKHSRNFYFAGKSSPPCPRRTEVIV